MLAFGRWVHSTATTVNRLPEVRAITPNQSISLSIVQSSSPPHARPVPYLYSASDVKARGRTRGRLPKPPSEARAFSPSPPQRSLLSLPLPLSLRVVRAHIVGAWDAPSARPGAPRARLGSGPTRASLGGRVGFPALPNMHARRPEPPGARPAARVSPPVLRSAPNGARSIPALTPRPPRPPTPPPGHSRPQEGIRPRPSGSSGPSGISRTWPAQVAWS